MWFFFVRMSSYKWLCWIKSCTLSGGCPQIYSYSVWEYWFHHTVVSQDFYNFKIFANLINSFTLQSLITCNNFSLYLLALCLWQNFNFLWTVLQLFDISTLGQHLFDVTGFKFLRKQFHHWSYEVSSFLSIWEQNSKYQFLQ